MTKKFFLALCLFILGTFISACGGGGKATPPSYPFIPVPTPEPTPAKYPIELSQTEFTVNIGETDNITVTLNGEDITQTATYTVDQEAIATVEGGLITGISAGSATVTVNAENAESEKTFTVNVIDPTLPTLEVNPTELNLGIEEESTVTVTLEGENVTEQVTYTSDDKYIAIAEKGVVKAKYKGGTANVTVSLEGANSTSFTVNVTDDSTPVTLNDEVLDKLHELGIITKGSADKAELTEANMPAIFIYNETKYKITSIGENIFKECTLLETVTIPDSVTTIGLGAFDSCTSLENVTIGNSVETLEDGAFYNCRSLKEIIIPDSVTTINGSAFSDCILLKEIVIPDSVTTMKSGAFAGCNSLETVIIGDGLTEIKSGIFNGRTNLKTVTIGKNVKTIEGGAFSGCTSLKEIVIPDSVTTIEGGAFGGCTNSELTIAIPDSVTTIEGGAFFNVPEITYTSKMKATGSPWGAKKVNVVVVQQ